MNFPGKKVTVLGLGVSGLQSAVFLKQHGYEVWVSDGGDSGAVKQRLSDLADFGITGEAGGHNLSRILDSDWVLISPGIPPASKIHQTIRKAGLPVFSEIEVASRFCPTGRVIAVTGTCGKTTVTTLIQRLIETSGKRAVSCGNIGNPWIGEIEGLCKDDFVVLEISSFQLEHCIHFRPWIGVLLNISANHEDWHEDEQAYVRAKLRIFQSQTERDTAIFRLQDRDRYFPEMTFRAQTRAIGQNAAMNPNEEVLRAVAVIVGIDGQVVDRVLTVFEGIEHRLEVFLQAGGVSYVNDSKSTTPSSLAWALDKYPDRKVILIAGGHPKSTDFGGLRGLVARKVKLAVLIGEARALLREAWQGAVPFFETDQFEEAVQKASAGAREGDVVLLSPACASFDMFKNYEERGRLFKAIVSRITGSSGAPCKRDAGSGILHV